MLQAFMSCLGRRFKSHEIQGPATVSAEQKYCDYDQSQAEVSAAVHQFVAILISAKTDNLDDYQFRKDLNNAVSTLSWSESLASAILGGLEAALRNGVKLGKTVELAGEKAMATAEGFAKDHPVYFTLIALGVLVLVAPWVLDLLGFAEIGIVEGKLQTGRWLNMIDSIQRIMGKSLAIQIRWICAQRLTVLLLSTPRYDLALAVALTEGGSPDACMFARAPDEACDSVMIKRIRSHTTMTLF